MNKTKEWWLKDAINKTEVKLENQDTPEQWIIDFFDGRIYQKEVDEPTNHNNCIPIKNK